MIEEESTAKAQPKKTSKLISSSLFQYSLFIRKHLRNRSTCCDSTSISLSLSFSRHGRQLSRKWRPSSLFESRVNSGMTINRSTDREMRMSSTVSTHEITTRTITTQTREKERTRTLLSLSLCVGAIGIHSSLPPTKREREEVSNRSVNERDVLLCVI